MLKKTINYTNFNEEKCSDEFFFNLTKVEIANMEFSVPGGFSALLKQIVETKNVRDLVSQFQNIILMSYGEKSPDGKRFIKNDELRTAFSQSAAFDELFFSLMDADEAAAFIKGVIPSDLIKHLDNTTTN